MKPPRLTSALPPGAGHTAGCTSMHFGENQLSPCSIGISPLPTAHPKPLQRSPVRPFTPCYGRCSLAMGGSHGFRSTRSDKYALFTLGFPRAPAVCALTRPLEVTRRVILQKARDHRDSRAILRLSLHGRDWFQALFHSPPRGAFPRSLTVLCTIGHDQYAALGRGRPSFPQDFSCPVVLELG